MSRLTWVLWLLALPSVGCSPAVPSRSPDLPAPGPRSQSIGVVDVQRVLYESIAGMAARQKLEEETATMKRRIDRKRRELEVLRAELSSPGRLTPDEQREKRTRFENLRSSTNQLLEDFNKELENMERPLVVQALAEIAALVEQLGVQRQYFLISERKALDALKTGSRPSAILYTAVSDVDRVLGSLISQDDLTGEVIKLYDARKAKTSR